MRRSARGQGMTEFIVIVALVAIGTIGVIGLFGDNLRHLFGASSEAVAGNARVTSAASGRDTSLEKKNMQNFGMSGTCGGATNGSCG